VRVAAPTETAIDRPSKYEKFQILVDDPAEDPRLGFREYADAFAEIVCGSPPRFAVGIFGTWGSGKTTLMKAIMARIEGRDDVIPVWFNAWRYEREQELVGGAGTASHARGARAHGGSGIRQGGTRDRGRSDAFGSTARRVHRG
jgi:hypothetical protein